MTAIILDCDPGHDDAMALLLAVAAPELRLLGVTTVAGNQSLDKTTANAIRVLDHVGRPDIPVAAGASRPLVREGRVAPEVHGDSGLDGPVLPAPSRAAESLHAIEWMAGALAAEPEPVTLVATAPLTNVALLLTRHPEMQERVARIVLMGGSIGAGNVTPAAEFNIWTDPEAARRVFTSGIEVTMVGLDVTHQALMTPAHARALARSGAAGRLVADLYAFYVRYHDRMYGWAGAPVHDPVAVAYLIDPTLLEIRHCGVAVDTTDGLARGATHVDVHGEAGWTPNCNVAVGIDTERFFDLLIGRIGAL